MFDSTPNHIEVLDLLKEISEQINPLLNSSYKNHSLQKTPGKINVNDSLAKTTPKAVDGAARSQSKQTFSRAVDESNALYCQELIDYARLQKTKTKIDTMIQKLH